MAIMSEGIIPQKINPIIIKDFVGDIPYVRNVAVRTFDNCLTISFLIRNELHELWVFNNEDPENEIYAGEKTVVNLPARGEGSEIVRQIIERFGGFYTADDHRDDFEYLGVNNANVSPVTFEIELYDKILETDSKSAFRFIIENKEALRKLLNKYQET